MNDIVKAPFPILFFALCEVGKPWPIILSYLFPSPSYTWGFDQYHKINPKEGRNNQMFAEMCLTAHVWLNL